MPESIIRRIKEAWDDPEGSQIVSESHYDFDLDNMSMRIRDSDFVFVNPKGRRALEMRPGQHVIKKIRKTANYVKHSISMLDPDWSPKSIFKGKPLDQVKVSHRTTEKFTEIILNVSTIHQFDIGARYRLDLHYEVALNNPRDFLLFTGAIQPSDYYIARDILKVNKARKSVTIVVHRRQPFVGYIFNPEEMNYFPMPEPARLGKFDQYKLSHELPKLMDDFDRAHYFTVAADLRNIL